MGWDRVQREPRTTQCWINIAPLHCTSCFSPPSPPTFHLICLNVLQNCEGRPEVWTGQGIVIVDPCHPSLQAEWGEGGICLVSCLCPADRVELYLLRLLWHNVKQENLLYQFKALVLAKYKTGFDLFSWTVWQMFHTVMMFSTFFLICQSFVIYLMAALWLREKSCASFLCWFWSIEAANCNMTRGRVVLRWSWGCMSRVRWWSDQGGLGSIAHTETWNAEPVWGSYFKEEPFWKFTPSRLSRLLFITSVVLQGTTLRSHREWKRTVFLSNVQKHVTVCVACPSTDQNIL